ncbi:MAG: hypothetical protein K1X53_04645, partial [Candidatus Sumerlaeaceae bacterium]|nr:hypothetical protein [Candidatus Sumerlaeaceae bacterium]
MTVHWSCFIFARRKFTGLLLALMVLWPDRSAVADCSAWTSPTLPIVYFAVATHCEDKHHPGTPDFVASKIGYVTFRNAILGFADQMTSRSIPWNWQSDYNFLLGCIKYEITTPDPALLTVTGGKNVVRYLHENLGVEIDAHSHENDGYNFADVAYLITQCGVTPSKTVGGHIYPTTDPLYQNWPKFIGGLPSQKYPGAYVYSPNLLMGGGTSNHVNDPVVSGIWTPQSATNYFGHSNAGTIDAFGEWSGEPADVQALINLVESGQLPYGKMWTAGKVFNQSDMTSSVFVASTIVPLLDSLVALRTAGKLQFIRHDEARTIWKTLRDGAPVAYQPAVTVTDRVTFSINVQGFSYPEKSAATLDRILTVHEGCNVPVDVFLDSTMTDIYQTSYPALLNRLKTSPVCAVSYHIRPPKPYYQNYDWTGMTSMTATQQQALVTNYETHGLDLVTGLPTSQAGGYQKLTSLLGYAPYCSAALCTAGIQANVDAVFKQLGSRMNLIHGTIVNVGTTRNGLYLKPEHYDLKLFEHIDENVGTLFEDSLTTAHTTAGAVAPYFIGVKMHDNDFFAVDSAWVTVYQ